MTISSGNNTAFFALAIGFGATSILLVIISLSTSHWEFHTYDTECVLSKNTSDSKIERFDDYYKLTLASNYTASAIADETFDGSRGIIVEEAETQQSLEYYIYDKYAGVWTICNKISDKSQADIYKGKKKKCFDYIAEYPLKKDSLSKKAIYYIQMRNAAISSLILDLLMLFGATVTATVGLVTNQVTCLMVTGVMFILTAFYTSMALLVMHVKMSKEVKSCTGLEEIPSLMCDCFHVYPDWSLYMAWIAVLTCIVSFFMWIHLTRLLSQIATKLNT